MESNTRGVLYVIPEKGPGGFIVTYDTSPGTSTRNRYAERQCASKIPLEMWPWQRTKKKVSNMTTYTISLLYSGLVIRNEP